MNILHSLAKIIQQWDWNPIWRRGFFVLIALSIVTGFWATHWRVENADRQARGELLSQVTAIAQTFNYESIDALSFTIADRENPIYQRLHRQMQTYTSTLGYRSIYTMVVRNGQIIFGVESLEPKDPLASPPGTVYRQPPPQLQELFQKPQKITIGPYRDEYGEFISAYASVVDPRTEKVVMVVAMDLEVAQWRKEIFQLGLVPLLFTLILLAALLGGRGILKRRAKFTPTIYPEIYLTAVFGLLLTLGIGALVQENQVFSRQKTFGQVAETRAENIAQELWHIQNQYLSTVAGLFEIDEEVSRPEFAKYTERMGTSPEVRNWNWLPQVSEAEKALFEAKARLGGLKDFLIFQRDSQGKKVPAVGRELYYPVFYVEPLGENKANLGYDLGSEPLGGGAILEAIATRRVTATESLTLPQKSKEEKEIAVFCPVFKGQTPQPQGLVSVVLEPQKVLRGNLVQTVYGDTSVSAQWLELKTDRKTEILASSSPVPLPDFSLERLGRNQTRELSTVYPVLAFGRTYAIIVRPGAAFLESNPLRGGWITILVGLGITTLVTILVAFVRHQSRLLEQQVKLQTAQLRKTGEELQERVKEMGCLVAVSRLCQEANMTTERLLQESVQLLPPAWQYPHLTCAKICFGGQTYSTANYTPSSWRLRADILVNHSPLGFIEVCLEEELPFLEEEKTLLKTLAAFLGRFIEYRGVEQALKKSERSYRQIFNSTNEAILIQEIDRGKIVDVNEPMLQLYGYRHKDEILGCNMDNFSAGDYPYTQKEAEEYIRKAVRKGYQVFEWLAKKRDGEKFWVEVSLRPYKTAGEARILAVVRDISDRKQQEQKIQYLTRLYATLSQINRAIIKHKERKSLLKSICEVAVEVGEFPLVWMGLIDPDSLEIVPYVSAGETTEYLKNTHITVQDIPTGRGPTGVAARENKLVICEDIANDPRMLPWRSQALKYGYQSSAAVPIKQKRAVIGVLSIYSREVGFFNQEERELLQEIGENISFALDAIQLALEQQRAEQKLQENEERLRLALEASSQGLYDHNLRTGEILVSPQYALMLGYDPENFQETHAKWRERLHPEEQESVSSLYQAYINGEIPTYQVEFRQRTATGDWKWILSMGKIVQWDVQGRPLRMLGTNADITERKQTEAQIQHLAYYDTLTALPNRRLLFDRLENTLFLAKRTQRYGALLFADLDHFKTLNDARGHNAGDKLLKEVAVRLKRSLRQADTVGRFGGDEFIILLPDLSDEQEIAARLALGVAEKTRRELLTPFFIEGEEVIIGASIGITLFPKGRETINDLLKEADTAMYQAKAAGRNSVRLFENQMQIEVESRFALEGEMRQGLEQNQFVVYLQPQVDNQGVVVGAEALLRWQHPSRGPIPPSTFIPLAEETGLIVPMGEVVIQQTCEFLARIQSKGSLLRLSINISPRQFRQKTFVAKLRAIFAATGVETNHITLEITEGLIIEDIHQAIATMLELKTLGVHFSIDDFGTGYSSLAYLKRLPINELKIDKSFVQDAPIDPNDAALVEAIIAVAHHFNLAIVAEGIETPEQAQFLKVRGCDFYQGHLYSKAVPISEFDENLMG